MTAANFLAQLKTVIPTGTIDFEKDSPDCALLAAWNERQRILAVIESRGTFFDAGEHSPTENDLFHALDMTILCLQANTAKGLLAKLWVSLDHCGGTFDDRRRERGDAIRRADFNEVTSFQDELDMEQHVLFSAISDLHRWVKFEIVYLPVRKAA